MSRRIAALSCFFLALIASDVKSAELASATLSSDVAFGGQSVRETAFVGWRFRLNVTWQIDEVGAHMMAAPDGEVFAAIVKLDAYDALPHGAPFDDDELVGAVLVTPEASNSEYVSPADWRLAPGAYALVLGSGQFGAAGRAALPNPTSQQHLAPTDETSFIKYQVRLPEVGAEWYQSLESHMRFVLRGVAVAGDADFFADGVVDLLDFEAWESRFGEAGSGVEISAQGIEFLTWQREFGTRVTSVATLVPEPSSMGLASALFACSLGRRRGGVLQRRVSA
ncbi:MAG: hypothetical protein KDA61_16300 [Planctomycetales bacterium]|nr:hypothetical protein [Planctomycetales bacterium]